MKTSTRKYFPRIAGPSRTLAPHIPTRRERAIEGCFAARENIRYATAMVVAMPDVPGLADLLLAENLLTETLTKLKPKKGKS
jgi:hypothetical protein